MKKKFNVKGMHCPSCEMIVTEELEELDGVQKATASFKESWVEVDFDDSKVDEEKIKKVIKNEGYMVE